MMIFRFTPDFSHQPTAQEQAAKQQQHVTLPEACNYITGVLLRLSVGNCHVSSTVLSGCLLSHPPRSSWANALA